MDCKNKRVILQIISAYGFGLLKGSVEIHATLMNKKLQTPTISANNNDLKFASEIIWYMDNATLKKLKMSCASIRVECVHIPTNTSSPNQRLGYLLLKLKEAQTINPKSNDRIENKSYKLIGTRNNCSYSFTMSLRIEDFNDKTVEIPSKKNKNLKLINTNHMNNDNNDNYHLQNVKEKNNLNESIENNLSKDYFNMLEQTEHLLEDNEQKVFNFNAQQKLIEELEDWKNEQMVLFNEKMKIKEEQSLKELNNKWFNDRKRIEEELSHEMSKCKALAENLDTMADKLKERETIVTAKELELVYQKDSMDNKYIDLVQNVQFSNVKTINDLNNNICELEIKLHNLEEINVLLKKENDQLKYDVNTNCSLQIQQLEKTISSLESKFEEANRSCMSYKERWIATVRKINQIYPNFHGNNENLYNNRKNVLNTMTNQLVERQHDEEKIGQLLNDLGKLRLDMANTNILDP